jgi:parvulin-like peptidyl-prolyl isomerase
LATIGQRRQTATTYRLSYLLALLFLGASAGQDALPLRMIVVSSPDEAEKIQEQLKGGADFAVLAREKSVDATAIDGGFMGSVDPGTLRAELRTALQGLRQGSVSQTVKIPRATPF